MRFKRHFFKDFVINKKKSQNRKIVLFVLNSQQILIRLSYIKVPKVMSNITFGTQSVLEFNTSMFTVLERVLL